MCNLICRCSLFSVLDHCGVDLPSSWDLMIFDNFSISNLKALPGTLRLQKKRDIKLFQLHEIVNEVRLFLKPLETVMPFLKFFHLNRSYLFDQFIRREMCNIGVNSVIDPKEQISRLVIVLEKAKTFLEKVMEGTIVYGDIYEYTATDLAQIEVEEEFRLFYMCPELKHYSEKGLEEMKSMLKLLKSIHYINKLILVCNQYELTGCLNDPELHKLTEVSKSLQLEENQRKLTPADAHITWKTVCDILGLNSQTNVDVLTVFETVSDSVEFFQFLGEMKFRDKEGETLFRQQHELVTAKLDQDAFTDSVLDHLYGAFFFIAPFMDQTQRLQDLMKKLDLKTQKFSSGQQQLETVKCHMHLITLWFSRVQVSICMYYIMLQYVSSKNERNKCTIYAARLG